MAGLEETIHKAGRAMRLGYTTGSCAALAAKAATKMLLTQQAVASCTIQTPKGIPVETPVLDITLKPDSARCAVQKDAGDDPDITDGILVYAEARFAPGGQITIDGGEGVGRVTRKGLDQPVGAAAINRVPRQMIEQEAAALCEGYGYDGGLRLTISIPGGAVLAAKTFNPQLGIVGGLSVIGTTGIVEPMSTQAILDTIDTEMKMYSAEGARQIILTPGNYGEKFLAGNPGIALRPAVKCSNFIGEALDMAALHGFSSVLVVGHIGKLVKLAGGIMDTHSKTADGRMELLALHTALAGSPGPLLQTVLSCVTTDEALSALAAAGLRDAVMEGVLAAADSYLARRVKEAFATGAVMFSQPLGLLGISPAGQAILARWRQSDG